MVNSSPTVTGFPDVYAKFNKSGEKLPGEKKFVCTPDGFPAARYPFG